MEPNFDKHLPQPDFDDNHFADCPATHGDEPCICPTLEREIREDFAAARYDLARGN